MSGTASAKSPPPGQPARCLWRMRRGLSSPAAATRSEPAATAAWRRWPWAAPASAALVADGFRIFVEIGPNPVLQSYLHDAFRAAESQGRVLATLSRKQPDEDPFPALAAQCHVAGYDITGAACFDGAGDPRGLPLYPWQRERCWFETTVEGAHLTDPAFVHPLLGFRQPG